jgi:integrin beta 3
MTSHELGDLVTMTLTETLTPVRTSVALLDDRLRAHATVTAGHDLRLRDLEVLVSGLRERLAIVETRAPVPGPPGRDGQDGKDGADGYGVEDLSVEFDGDRTIALAFARAGREVQRFPLVLPFQKYQGVYHAGTSYVAGDMVTYGGSLWHCGTATSARPGDGVTGWTLAVKRGQDGRDARAS